MPRKTEWDEEQTRELKWWCLVRSFVLVIVILKQSVCLVSLFLPPKTKSLKIVANPRAFLSRFHWLPGFRYCFGLFILFKTLSLLWHPPKKTLAWLSLSPRNPFCVLFCTERTLFDIADDNDYGDGDDDEVMGPWRLSSLLSMPWGLILYPPPTLCSFLSFHFQTFQVNFFLSLSFSHYVFQGFFLVGFVACAWMFF